MTMNEKELIKSITDEKMPDLEKIRENCTTPPEKKKVFKVKYTTIAIAAALSLTMVLGMVAAFARDGGVFFSRRTAETVNVTEHTLETDDPKEKKSKKDSQEDDKKADIKSVKEDEEKSDKKDKTKKNINRLKKSDIDVSRLYNLGKAEGYHICLAWNGNKTACSYIYIIGDYTFRSTAFYSPYSLGLYAVGKEQSYPLDEAYRQGEITDMEQVAGLVNGFDKTDTGITASLNSEEAVQLAQYFSDWEDVVTLADLGSVEDCPLYYLVSGETGGKAILTVGDYEFKVTGEKLPYPPGLYTLRDGSVYTLSEAYEQGFITDMDAVINLLQNQSSVEYNFVLAKQTPSVPETTAAAEETRSSEPD